MSNGARVQQSTHRAHTPKDSPKKETSSFAHSPQQARNPNHDLFFSFPRRNVQHTPPPTKKPNPIDLLCTTAVGFTWNRHSALRLSSPSSASGRRCMNPAATKTPPDSTLRTESQGVPRESSFPSAPSTPTVAPPRTERSKQSMRMGVVGDRQEKTRREKEKGEGRAR